MAGIAVTVPLDPYLSLKALAGYSGLSLRTLRNRLKDSTHPLPYHRIGGKIVVRRSDYDAWAARYRCVGDPDLDQTVAEALRDVRGPGKPRKRPRVAA
jgi:predicted DNA-binding transcriptional regulator AlpA